MKDEVKIQAFHRAMTDIYRRRMAEGPLMAYTAVAFGVEVRQYGGLETAKRCIHAEGVSEGWAALCQLNRLDLTLEALIHENSEWHELFSQEELAICTMRLKARGYKVRQ